MHVIKCDNQKSYYRPHQLIGVVLRATLALSWAALRTPTDIVYIGKPHPMNGIAGFLSKYLRGSTIVVDCDDYEAGLGHFSGQWQRKIVELFEKCVPRMGQRVTTHTDFMRTNLIAWGVSPEKIVYLPNGVDPKRFTPPDPRRVEAECKRLDLTGKKVVAYIGSLSMPSHPVNLLVDAFAQLQQEIPETILLIVGGGEEMSNLQKQVTELGIESATRFLGHVQPEEISLYYALADVSSDPIHDDAGARGRTPLKLFESWICGVPFVTANVGERTSLMGDPPAGVLVTPGKSEAFAKGILAVISDFKLAIKIITRGQTRVKDFYWMPLTEKLEDVFFQLKGK